MVRITEALLWGGVILLTVTLAAYVVGRWMT